MKLTPERKLIRAASYMLSPEEKRRQEEMVSSAADPLSALLYSDDRDTVLYGIFGDVPDYSTPEMENLWEEVLDADPEKMFDYCLRNGVDPFQDDGRPVAGWRDIVVMLKAIEQGILELAD